MAKQNRKKSALDQVGGVFTSIDFFGETADFSIEGKRTVKSVFGALISLVIVVVTFVYGTNKFIIMYNRENTDYQTIETEVGLEVDRIFEQTETGAFIAFGLASSSNQSMILPEQM